MLETFILFVLAYLLRKALFNKRVIDGAADKHPWFKRRWLIHAGFYAFAASVLPFLFGFGSLPVVLSAIVSGCVHYLVNVRLLPLFKEHFTYFIIHQLIQLGIIYLVLLSFGITGKPEWMLEQLYTFLFAKQLVIEEGLIVPSLLVMLVFLTSASSDLIGRFLQRYGNPMLPQMQESAAALELNEGTQLKKRILRQSIPADMAVEEQIEVSSEADPANPVKTKESIKVQYHWYNKEEDSSKGKYIGILERLLVCVFVFYEIYHGLMLLGAMKTLARFKLFENKAFAEYYLIGTLLSLLVAVICGFILQRMLIDAVLV